MGSLGSGMPRDWQSWGGSGAGQQVRTLAGAGRLQPEQLWVERGWGGGWAEGRKWQIFCRMGVSVSQSPYPGGPRPSPLLPLQQAAPLLTSWKSGKVTSESAPSQVPQEEEVHTPGRQGAADPEEALGKDGPGAGVRGMRGPQGEKGAPEREENPGDRSVGRGSHERRGCKGERMCGHGGGTQGRRGHQERRASQRRNWASERERGPWGDRVSPQGRERGFQQERALSGGGRCPHSRQVMEGEEGTCLGARACGSEGAP